MSDWVEDVLAEHRADEDGFCVCDDWSTYGITHVAAKVRERLAVEVEAAKAEALDELRAWVADFAGPATNIDDAISDVLRSVWQEIGYRAHIIREQAAALTPPQQGREDEGGDRG